MAFLGICEAGCATRQSTDLLAEVTDSLLRLSCKTHPTQTTVDNLDYQAEHLTIDYKEVESTITSHLSNVGMRSIDVPDLFNTKEILIEEEKHSAELQHIEKVVANTVGRILGGRIEQVFMN